MTPEYLERLRISLRGAPALARARQRKREAKGNPTVLVTVTAEDLWEMAARQNACCALTGLPFWSDQSGSSYGPTIPSLDRINSGGDYSVDNLRITLLGVNSLRGCGTDADMYRIARALVDRQ